MGTPTNSILQARGVEVLESPQLVQASALLGAAGLEALVCPGCGSGTPAYPGVASAGLDWDEAERLQQGHSAVLVAEGESSGSLSRAGPFC